MNIIQILEKITRNCLHFAASLTIFTISLYFKKYSTFPEKVNIKGCESFLKIIVFCFVFSKKTIRVVSGLHRLYIFNTIMAPFLSSSFSET